MSGYLLIIHLSLFICSRVRRYLRRLVFSFKIRATYFEVVISFKPFNSTGAISFSINHFNGVSFEWALTHKSFPRILPESSNFSGLIFKFISKFDVRMNCNQSNVFLQDLSNTFPRWLHLTIILYSIVSEQFMVVFLVIILEF